MSADRIQPTLGRQFFALLRDNTGGVRTMPQGNLQHFLGRRHLQIERQIDLIRKAFDILVGDVATVLAKMRGDAVGARLRRHDGGANRIRMPDAPRVSNRRHMVDVYAQSQISLFHHALPPASSQVAQIH